MAGSSHHIESDHVFERDLTGLVRFDKVLVDVPCSGLGVLSKRADLRWRRKAQDVADLVKVQVSRRQYLNARQESLANADIPWSLS